MRLGKLDAAVNSLEKALAIKPDYPDAYFNLGNTFQKLRTTSMLLLTAMRRQ